MFFTKWKRFSINLIQQINFEAQIELNKTSISLNELNAVKKLITFKSKFDNYRYTITYI